MSRTPTVRRAIVSSAVAKERLVEKNAMFAAADKTNTIHGRLRDRREPL